MIDWTPYIGIPYKDLGNTTDGCDCYGLISILYKSIWGLSCPEYAPEESIDARGSFIQEKTKECFVPFPLSGGLVGTVILFNIVGNPVHIGMVTHLDAQAYPSKFIHCMNGHNSVIQRYTNVWKNRKFRSFLHKDFLCGT